MRRKKRRRRFVVGANVKALWQKRAFGHGNMKYGKVNTTTRILYYYYYIYDTGYTS